MVACGSPVLCFVRVTGTLTCPLVDFPYRVGILTEVNRSTAFTKQKGWLLPFRHQSTNSQSEGACYGVGCGKGHTVLFLTAFAGASSLRGPGRDSLTGAGDLNQDFEHGVRKTILYI